MWYLICLIISLLGIFIISRIDKNFCINNNDPNWVYKEDPYDEWITYYQNGRSRIYAIGMLIGLIPFVNFVTAGVTLLILLVLLGVKLVNFLN